MDPKRTDFSLTKPARTSFSLGMDDYAARTRGSKTATTTFQDRPVADTAEQDLQGSAQTIMVNDNPAQQYRSTAKIAPSNVIDGFSTKIKPRAAVQQTGLKFSFKAFINQMLNSGLRNPGYLAMAASITAIKGFLSQSKSTTHTEASTAEALEVGRFMVEHAEDDDRFEEPVAQSNSAIELAAASLKSDTKLKDSSGQIKNHGRKIAAGEHLKNLSLKARTNRHKVRSIVAASVACGIILVSGGLMYANAKNLPEGNISGSTSLYVSQIPKEEPSQTDENNLQPNRLKIGSLNIDAPSVIVGLTPDNAVDVPEKISDAAWFNGSALPGKPGTTFMLGHYAAGYGGIFDNLAKIKEGDVIEVSDANGEIFKYKVMKKDKQKVADINMDAILTSDGENRLVIMTCAGSYIAQNYTDRLIVTATPTQ